MSTDAQRCREKTGRGNVFRSKAFAKAQASKVRKALGQRRIRAYRCPCCGLFHLGKSQDRRQGEVN